MSMKEETKSKSCSAVFTAGNSSKISHIGSLVTIPGTRRSTAGNNSIHTQKTSKKTLIQVSSFTTNTSRNKISLNKQDESTENICNCSNCFSLESIPKYLLQTLQDQAQELQRELSKEKNNSQLLRRDFWMAKRVVLKEIGVDKEKNFENLLKKASDESWKGRQEMILILKRKLRDLHEMVNFMEAKNNVVPLGKKDKAKTEESQGAKGDDRKIWWCLEFEKQQMWKSAQRVKQYVVTGKDTMNSKLESLTGKNKELIKDICIVREQLASLPKQMDEKFIERLRSLEAELKCHLEEKAESRQKLDELEQLICQNNKISSEIKSKIDAEKLNLIEVEETLKSLKAKEDNLYAMSEEVKKDLCKRASTITQKLQEEEKKYVGFSLQVEKLIEEVSTYKKRIHKFKLLQTEMVPVSVQGNSVKDTRDESKNKRMDTYTRVIPINVQGLSVKDTHDESKYKRMDAYTKPKQLTDTFSDSRISSYKNKLLKYQSVLQALRERNDDKLKAFYNLLSNTKEEIFTLLKNRCTLWKSTLETSILKNHLKKCRKIAKYPSKQKLVRKKNSSSHLVEVIDERKMFLAIGKRENKYLKTLIRHIFVSKEEDCDLLESFLCKNKDVFINLLVNMKI